jgi:hypothetical protein
MSAEKWAGSCIPLLNIYVVYMGLRGRRVEEWVRGGGGQGRGSDQSTCRTPMSTCWANESDQRTAELILTQTIVFWSIYKLFLTNIYNKTYWYNQNDKHFIFTNPLKYSRLILSCKTINDIYLYQIHSEYDSFNVYKHKKTWLSTIKNVNNGNFR